MSEFFEYVRIVGRELLCLILIDKILNYLPGEKKEIKASFFEILSFEFVMIWQDN